MLSVDTVAGLNYPVLTMVVVQCGIYTAGMPLTVTVTVTGWVGGDVAVRHIYPKLGIARIGNRIAG